MNPQLMLQLQKSLINPTPKELGETPPEVMFGMSQAASVRPFQLQGFGEAPEIKALRMRLAQGLPSPAVSQEPRHDITVPIPQELKHDITPENEYYFQLKGFGETPEIESLREKIARGFTNDGEVKHPGYMTEEEFNIAEGRGMGVSWRNAIKLPDGTIIQSSTKEHGDMIGLIEEEFDVDAKDMERGWTWIGITKEESYIGVPDVQEAKGSFYQAYKNKLSQQNKN